MYASRFSVTDGNRSRISVEISTAVVESASERQSAAVARMTDESIFLPSFLLNRPSQSLTRIEPISTPTATQLRSGSSGEKILEKDSLMRSTPITRMKKETIMDATYSIRACPKGCSRSAGFAEMRKEISEMICDPASERLLIASAVIETDPNSVPTVNLAANKSRFKMMPTMLANIP